VVRELISARLILLNSKQVNDNPATSNPDNLMRSGAPRSAALPYVTSGNYEGEHWLASFAVYMLTTPSP